MADNKNFINVRIDGEESVPVAPEIGGMNAGAVNSGATVHAQPNVNGAPDVTSVAELMQMFDAPSGISAEGSKFLAEIAENLTDSVRNSKNGAWSDIQIVQLAQPNDTHAFISNNYAVILIMAESNIGNPDYPVIAREEIAAEDLRRIRPDVVILKIVVVDTNDYGKAANYASAIRNIFLYKFSPIHVSLASLTKDGTLSISDNDAEYMDAYRKLSPHAVPLRHDLTLVIYNQPRFNQNLYQFNNMNECDRFLEQARNTTGRLPLATIGGYVEFVRVNSYAGVVSYLPVIHITEIHSAIIADELLSVYLVFAVKRWFSDNMWQSFYRNCKADGHGNVTNIGYLIPDGAGGRCKITSDDNFNHTIFKYFKPAQVVLDVVEGRFSLPGIWKLTQSEPQAVNEVINSYVAFMNNGIAPYASNSAPYFITDVNYRGIYQYGNKVMDTAYIDFMNEYPRHPSDAIRCEKLLLRKATPELAVKDQKEWEPDMKLLYRTEVVGFNPTYIGWLEANMPLLSLANTTQQTGYACTDALVQNADNWGTYGKTPVGAAGYYQGLHGVGGRIYW